LIFVSTTGGPLYRWYNKDKDQGNQNSEHKGSKGHGSEDKGPWSDK